MSGLALAVTLAAVGANGAVAAADLRPAGFVLANSAAVGVSRSQLPLLAALKAAGAVGLLVGLAGLEPIGIAAAAGLVLFFTGALVLHVRHGVLHNLLYPVTYWLLAAGALVATTR